ncbi:PREDICTED: proline-rich receptor-like protein kinase PERK4 isoform X2 [Prunus mume]|nr:PREDICTED: proline-rich receptor-like protein kinase PERK4 isoform X2 [Prunus mume]
MSSDSAPSPDHSSPPSPDSSSSSPSPKESPKESPPAKPPSSPPPSSPPPSAPPPSSPPPSSPPPSSPPPPKDSAPPPKGSSSSPPPKAASSSPPPPKEATPALPPPKEQAAKSPPAVPTPPAAVTEANDTAAATTPPHARPKTSPTGALSPPSHGSSTPSTESSDEDSSSSTDNKGKIAGVAIGASLVIIVLLVVCVVCIRRKRRKRREMQYYGDPADHHKGGGGYYNNTQQQNWHDMNNPQGDHVVRLNNQAPGGGAWPSGPPPTSGEASTNFSGPPLPPPSPTMSLGFNKSTFTYDELAAATNGFSEANLLGQGGFGYVHKGVLPNGKEVAVKSLKSGSGQGEREFAAEVEIISRVHHRHLVSLVGYCIAGGQRMLVYEFVENKTMEYHLHGKGLPPMDWPTRLRIAVGSAKGLAYLHEDCHPKIIHRDIKSANILLDFNFEAMVADFGLAKLSSDNYTHVSTRVMGTFGYLAPEYASSGKLSEKSDVFSFGVMLLELITGKRPVDPSNAMDDSLVDWARPLLNRSLEEGNHLELVDIRLDNNFNPQEMARMVACAAASIRHSARKRPKMSQIVRALEGDVSLDDLNEGTKPGQSSMFNAAAGGGSSDYDTQAYNADMKKFRKLALSSQEFGSSEFGTSSNDSREMSGTPKNPKQQLV